MVERIGGRFVEWQRRAWETRAAAACVSLAVAACGARTPTDSMGAAGAAAGTGGSGSGGSSGSTGGSGGSAGIYVDGGFGVSCPATCNAQHGAPFELTTIDEVYRSLAGRWLICGRANDGFLGAPADTIGVEFKLPAGPNPDLLYLVDSPSGPQPGAGSAYRVSYVVESLMAPFYRITLHAAVKGELTGSYRSCPTEHLVGAFNGDPIARSAWLVPFP